MSILFVWSVVGVSKSLMQFIKNRSLIKLCTAMCLKRRCSQKVENVEETQDLTLLDLPELALESILTRLSPASLCSAAGVCREMRKRCTSDHLWELHTKAKWDKVVGPAARTEWQWTVAMNAEAGISDGANCKSWRFSWSCVWPFSWLNSKPGVKRKPKIDSQRDSFMAWYIALETGSFWFPAQVYNRENGQVGFMLSCYDAELGYERRTNTFNARYPPHGPRADVIEDGVQWERIPQFKVSFCPTMAMDVIALTSINKFILNNNDINNYYPKFCLQTRRRTIDEQTQLNSSKLFRAYPSLFVKYGSRRLCEAKAGGSGTPDRQEDDEVDAALHIDGQIPDTSDKFVKQVSSRAYDMRRQLKQSIDSSSYDVLEANPWRGDSREDSKAVYVLAQGENQLWTMRTRRTRSEVEHELGMLFPKQGKKRTENSSQRKNSSTNTRFRMLVEDVREGVLVFEDESDAINYCNLLENQHGQGCAGVAELDASSVFDLCRKMKALAVLFRRGRAHPLPDSLELDLKARKRSLEDQE